MALSQKRHFFFFFSIVVGAAGTNAREHMRRGGARSASQNSEAQHQRTKGSWPAKGTLEEN